MGRTRKLPQGPGVYRITCKRTGDSYIGATKNISTRWANHRNKPFGRMKKLIRKYGTASMKVEVLEECPIELLNERERHWWAELKPTINATEPSKTTARSRISLGRKHTEVVRVDAQTLRRIKEIAAAGRWMPGAALHFIVNDYMANHLAEIMENHISTPLVQARDIRRMTMARVA